MSETDDMNAAVIRTRALIDGIKRMLAGQGGEVQGAALSELVALHVAGHAPALREEMLALHVRTVRAMVPLIERELFGVAGHPAGPAP